MIVEAKKFEKALLSLQANCVWLRREGQNLVLEVLIDEKGKLKRKGRVRKIPAEWESEEEKIDCDFWKYWLDNIWDPVGYKMERHELKGGGATLHVEGIERKEGLVAYCDTKEEIIAEMKAKEKKEKHLRELIASSPSARAKFREKIPQILKETLPEYHFSKKEIEQLEKMIIRNYLRKNSDFPPSFYKMLKEKMGEEEANSWKWRVWCDLRDEWSWIAYEVERRIASEAEEEMEEIDWIIKALKELKEEGIMKVLSVKQKRYTLEELREIKEGWNKLVKKVMEWLFEMDEEKLREELEERWGYYPYSDE